MKASELKAKVSPAAFYERVLGLHMRGQRLSWVDGGLCPFHKDHRKGNFRVNLESGAFKCFACGVGGGDIIKFVELRERVNFLEAMRALSHSWGIV